MSIVIICAFWCVVGYLYHKFCTREPPDRQEPDSILRLLEISDELHQLTIKYRQIDTMLTNINLIGTDSEKGITLDVPSLTGHSAEYNFICGISDTDDFTRALQAEQQRLKAEIIKAAESVGESLTK